MIIENKKIAEIFEDIAFLLEIEEENPFKIRSYKRVAELIKQIKKPIREIREEGKLKELEGVGEAISKKIEEILNTGDCNLRKKLLSKYSESVLRLRKIKGIGAKTAKKLVNKFGPDINLKTLIENKEVNEILSQTQLKNIKFFLENNV